MGGILSSNISMTICEVEEKLSITPELLRKSAFSESIDPDGFKLGWTGLGELLDNENFEFALVDARFSGFSFRLDERRPSQAVIRLQVEKKIREETLKGGKPGSKRKKEIRDQVTETILAQTEFAPILIDCLWDQEKKRLLVGTTSERRVEKILSHFKNSFGTEAWPITPEREMSNVFAAIQGAGGIEVNGFFLETIGSANLASSPQSEEKRAITVQNSADVVTEAITHGMRIKKMAFIVRENGTDTECKLTLGDDLTVRSLKLPRYDGEDGKEGLFLLNADLCAQISDLVISLGTDQ